MRRHSREFHTHPLIRSGEEVPEPSTMFSSRPRKGIVAFQLACLVFFNFQVLNHLRIFSAILGSCQHYRCFHVPYCLLMDIVLGIFLCLFTSLSFISHKSFIFSNTKRRLWLAWSNTRTRYLLILSVFAIGMLALYAYYGINVARTHMHRADKQPCHTKPETLKALVDLGEAISSSFFDLGVNVFLDYGSLLGAMRYNAPLPWDRDIDMGILKEQLMDKGIGVDVVMLSFSQHGITDYYYDYWYGFFRAYGEFDAAADMMLWYDYFGTGYLKRIGWEAFFGPLAYSLFHNFPRHLVEPPTSLPIIRFGNGTFNIPREPLEFLKFRYEENWFKEVRPHGCEKETYVHWDGVHPPYLPFKEPEYVATAIAAQATSDAQEQEQDETRHGVTRLDLFLMD
eukprot:CFRG4797T1